MHARLWIAAAVAATPMLVLSPAAFPASREAGCAKIVAGARYNQRLFTSLMRRKDALAERTLAVYKVPRVSSRDVKPVSDPVICSRAAEAYSAAINDKSDDRKVHILRVGNRYIVMDAEYRPDDYHRAATFDSTFTRPLALVAE